jgi:hypothetical protein
VVRPDRAQRPGGIVRPGWRRGAPAVLAGALGLAVAMAGVAPRDARANGAFPDSQSVLTPGARPNEISLVTNFGVVASHDGGHTWLWSCEQDTNALGYLYQYNAAPQNRLFAVANQNLVFSDDATCGWSIAKGMIAGLGATDFFPDPTDANRVLALAFDYASSTYLVLQSTDAGTTFTSKLYTSDAKATMTGIEIARSDPKTVYVTLTAATTNAPMLGHSTDGGATWKFTDLTSVLGAGTPSIIAVDPTNAQSVLLLFKGTKQSLAVSQDGGQTVTSSMTTAGYFTSATRTGSGAILVAGVDASTNPVLYRSTDHGATFQTVGTQPPHIRAMSARGNQIYAAADNFSDGYALGVSTDDGISWQSVLSYDHVAAILGCVKQACQTNCAAQAMVGLWDLSLCSADPPPASDGGASAADAATGSGGAGGGGGTGGHTKSSSGCAVSPREADGWLLPSGGLAVLALWLARRRR